MKLQQTKANLLKDITSQYGISLISSNQISRYAETFLNRIEAELSLGMLSSKRMTTKVGIQLRNILIENHRVFANKVHEQYCRHEELRGWIIDKIQVLEEAIQYVSDQFKQVEFSLQQLKDLVESRLKFNTHRNDQFKITFHLTSNKENLKLGNQNSIDASAKPPRIKGQEIDRLISHKRKRSEVFMKTQSTFQQNEISQINCFIEQKLLYIGNFSSISLQIKQESLNSLKKNEKHPPYESQSSKSHGVSLGLQSFGDDTNLLCDQDIDDLEISRLTQLQRITEREEEYSSNSSVNPIANGRIIFQGEIY